LEPTIYGRGGDTHCSPVGVPFYNIVSAHRESLHPAFLDAFTFRLRPGFRLRSQLKSMAAEEIAVPIDPRVPAPRFTLEANGADHVTLFRIMVQSTTSGGFAALGLGLANGCQRSSLMAAMLGRRRQRDRGPRFMTGDVKGSPDPMFFE